MKHLGILVGCLSTILVLGCVKTEYVPERKVNVNGSVYTIPAHTTQKVDPVAATTFAVFLGAGLSQLKPNEWGGSAAPSSPATGTHCY